MSGNRVVVHKRNQNSSHLDQPGSTIPMAELFDTSNPPPAAPKPKPDRPPRLMPIPLEQAASAGDLPQASLVGRAIHAVIFDLDEVLVDSRKWRFQALQRPLEWFGSGITPDIQTASDGSIQATGAILEHLSAKGFPKILHGMIARLEQACSLPEIQSHCQPRFEKEYLLLRLKQQGYRMAVASDCDRATTELILTRSGLLPYFEAMVCREDALAHPSPHAYLTICDRLGLRPKQVVAIESSARGIDAAHRAGLHVCETTGIRELGWTQVGKFLNQIDSRGTEVPPC